MCAIGRLSDHHPWVWIDQHDQAHPLTDRVQTGIAAARGETDGIHVVLADVRIGPHPIPDLGVGVGTDGIWLDYRKGAG